jgi:hypothetical protein
MRNQTLPLSISNLQPDAPDADAQLRAARRDTRMARARQCRIEASVALFWVDAATTEEEVAAWMNRRALLLAEAERLEAQS